MVIQSSKSENFKKKIVSPSSSLVYGKRVFSDAAKNGTIFGRN